MTEQWKCGNEFAPYHPSASHIHPDHRDSWNACYKAAQPVIKAIEAERDAALERVKVLEADARRYRVLRSLARHPWPSQSPEWVQLHFTEEGPTLDEAVDRRSAAIDAAATADKGA